MKFRTMIRHYSKVFLSFLLLVFLVAVLPATASALINQATEMRLGEFSGNYFSFQFLPKDYNEGGIIYLKSEKEAPTGAEPPRSVKGYGGLSVNDIRGMLANAGIRATEVYLPLYVSDENSSTPEDWIILVPLLGGYRGADCYVSGETAKDKTEGAEIRYYYTYFIDNFQGYDGVATIRIGTVKVLPRNDEKSRVLRAILKRWEKYDDKACIASPEFARKLLKPYGVGDDLGELSIGSQGIIVITDGSQSIGRIYQALSREAARYNLSVVMNVLTPRWVSAAESTNKSLWDYLWGYVALFLPVLPAMLVIMGREKEGERRMRYLISTSGGREIVLDLITAGTVLFALGVSAVFLGRKAAFLSAVMLLLVYVLRNFVAGRELGRKLGLTLLSLILLGLLGVLLHYSVHLRILASGILGLLLSWGGSDISLLFSLVSFRYLPGVLISLGVVSLFLLLLNRGGPHHRAAARLLPPGVLSLGVLFLYTSLLFSAPLVSLASISDVYGGGATGVVSFGDSNNLLKAYNLTHEVISERGVMYATLWSVGSIGEGKGMTYSTHGRILCYDGDFLKFLKKAGGMSTTARLLYSKLYSLPNGVIVPQYSLEKLKRYGAVQVSGNSLTISVIDDSWNVHRLSAPYETVEMLPGGVESPIISCEVARKNGLKPLPKYLLIYGDSKTTGEVMRAINGTVVSKYPKAFSDLWSLGGISSHVQSQFEDPKGFIPLLLSGFLMAATGVVIGIRDGRRLFELVELMKINGKEPLSIRGLILLPLLVLAFVPVLMLRDGYSFASMGFVGKGLALISASPLLGLFAGLVLYFASILGEMREV